MPRKKMFPVLWKNCRYAEIMAGVAGRGASSYMATSCSSWVGEGIGGKGTQNQDSARDPLLRPADATLLDLVEQCLVAHAQTLSRLAAIPVHLPERMFDRGP